MKRIFYKLVFTVIMLTGLMIGVVKGQEARQKWVSKKKNKYEQHRHSTNESSANSQVVLDEFEMAAYHS